MNSQRDISYKNDTIIIGYSKAMVDILKLVDQVAPTKATILVTGESGTGKELIAKAIHNKSNRRDKALVTLNCAAIPENLLESELFGHVKGSFTGAINDKAGIIKSADKGILFLDEIGELTLSLQSKLLRLLQEGEYRSVGSEKTEKVDIRFLAATNINLKEAVKQKTFREDLYYRLNVIHIRVPTLSERKEDIPVLAYHFLKEYNRKYNKRINTIAPAAIEKLISHNYSGNVRELKNIIERAVILCDSSTIEIRNLFNNEEEIAETDKEIQDIYNLPFKQAKETMLNIFHKKYLQLLLWENSGNISKSANKAGIKRQYLHRLIKATGINVTDFKNN